METSARMLRLLSLLQTHRFWSGVELAARLEVSDRTLRRDIDRLRDLGYEVRSRRGAEGGYQLEAGSALPPLLLDDEEAVAIAVGLRTTTSGAIGGIEEISLAALAKLEQILPPRLRRRIGAINASVVPLTWPGPRIDAAVLATIAQACRDQERVRFAYRTRQGAESERHVEPHRLVPAGRRWYLVAWDLDRGDWRTFRVDRIEEPRTSGWRFEARTLPAADAAAFVEQAIASTPARFNAVVTVHAPAADVAHRMRWMADSIEPVDDDTCTLRSKADSLDWLVAGLTLAGADFEVHEPPELIERLRELNARIATAVAAVR